MNWSREGMFRRPAIVDIDTNSSELVCKEPAIHLLHFQTAKTEPSSMVKYYQRATINGRSLKLVHTNWNLIAISCRNNHILFLNTCDFWLLCCRHSLPSLSYHVSQRWNVTLNSRNDRKSLQK